MSDIKLGTAKAKPGEKRWGQLLVREGKKRVKLPTCAVNGMAEGEHVVVIANQHGGEVVCHIVDPFTGRVVEKCCAPMSGAIYSIYTATHKPKYVCQKGDRLFAVGHARQLKTAKLCREMGPEPYRRDPWGPE